MLNTLDFGVYRKKCELYGIAYNIIPRKNAKFKYNKVTYFKLIKN